MDFKASPSHEVEILRLTAFGIGIIVAAAVFGIALVVSDDLRLLYLTGALLLAVGVTFAGRQNAGRLGRRGSTSFRIDVPVCVLCPATNPAFCLANSSAVDGGTAGALSESIR